MYFALPNLKTWLQAWCWPYWWQHKNRKKIAQW